GPRREQRGHRCFCWRGRTLNDGPGSLEALALLLHRLVRIASRYRLVPRRMVRPRPGFAHRPAGHRLDGMRFAESTEIHVEENAKQHDQRGNVVDHIGEGHGNSAKYLRKPHYNASYNVGDAAADDLPELHLLPRVEEPHVSRFHTVFVADVALDALHPFGVGRGP